tara:strand:+ start:85 stop:426 length:342 start_codon:yes stop_codon:yes gene_type:complete
VLFKDCLFCKIIRGQIPCCKVFENEKILAFKDINPVAKVHVLIIPKIHIENTGQRKHIDILGELLISAEDIAHKLNIFESGYRIIINRGKDAGQIIDHIHLHLIGGEPLNPIN